MDQSAERAVFERPSVTPEGDRCVRVQIAETLTREAIEMTWRFRKAVDALCLAGVRGCTAAYCVVNIAYDPAVISFDRLAAIVGDLQPDAFVQEPQGRTITIPVCYGDEYGPDLGDVAGTVGMSPDMVVSRHCEPDYCVAAVGFVPGFAYLYGLPESLNIPRLATSRVRVPPGSVAIAGAQTGIYPLETPGGWRIIGRTPLTMFDCHRTPASLLELGDTVRFEPISPQQYREMAAATDKDSGT